MFYKNLLQLINTVHLVKIRLVFEDIKNAGKSGVSLNSMSFHLLIFTLVYLNQILQSLLFLLALVVLKIKELPQDAYYLILKALRVKNLVQGPLQTFEDVVREVLD